MLSLQTNIKLDMLSLQMARAVGSLLLTSGLNAYAAYSSLDEEEKEAHIRSRVLGNLVLLMAMTYAQVMLKLPPIFPSCRTLFRSVDFLR